MTTVGELFIALGFDFDDKALKEFRDSIKGGWDDLKKISVGALAAGYAINALASSSIRNAQSLRQFNIETGQSIDLLQKWQIAGQMANPLMNREEISSSIRAINNEIENVMQGKGESGAFARMGMDNVRGKNAFQVLEEIRGNYARMVRQFNAQGQNGPTLAAQLVEQMGISPGLLPALTESREKFNASWAGKIVSPQDQQKLLELGTQLTDLDQRFVAARTHMIAAWSPNFIDFLNKALPVLEDFKLNVNAVADAIHNLWNQNKDAQPVLLAFASEIFIYCNPLITLFSALAFAVNDLGKGLRGLPNVAGWLDLKFLNLMHSQEGSTIANWKRNLAARGNGAAENITNPYFDQADFSGIKKLMQPVSNDFLKSPADRQTAAGTQVVMNNAYQIHTLEDAFAISNQINNYQQRQLNYTFTDIHRSGF